MSTSMMRVPDTLKDKLEELKTTYYLKTHYEVIEKLIDTTERQKSKIGELQKGIEGEKERREQQDVYLGDTLKMELAALQKELALKNPADAIAFLLANYSGNISKEGFQKYVELRG